MFGFFGDLRGCGSCYFGELLWWDHYDVLVIFWPWSAPGGRDNVSAGILVFPGMCWIS